MTQALETTETPAVAPVFKVTFYRTVEAVDEFVRFIQAPTESDALARAEEMTQEANVDCPDDVSNAGGEVCGGWYVERSDLAALEDAPPGELEVVGAAPVEAAEEAPEAPTVFIVEATHWSTPGRVLRPYLTQEGADAKARDLVDTFLTELELPLCAGNDWAEGLARAKAEQNDADDFGVTVTETTLEA